MASPFLAEIVLFAGTFAPRGWAFCSGQLLPISQNTALFSLLGTTYGGDGRVTFALPDLRGRVPVGSEGNSSGPGLPAVMLGQKGGANTHTLTAGEIPSHTHAANCAASGTSNVAVNNFWANDAGVSSATYNTAGGSAMNAGAIGNTGGSQAHNNLQPYVGLNYIIAVQGTFPSRS